MKRLLWRITFCGIVAVVALGCDSNGGDGSTVGSDIQTETVSDPIEIFLWWTAPGELQAFDAYVGVLKRRHPEVDIVDLSKVAGNGEAAHKVLRQRLSQKRLPDAFQVHPYLLGEFVDPKNPRVEQLDSLFDAEYWQENFPKNILETVTHGGHIYAVPLGIHRRNTMYSNPELVTEPPESMEEFIGFAKRLKKKGIPALAVSTARGDWPLLIVFNSVLAGSAGIRYFNDFYTGQLNFGRTKNVRKLKKAVTYFSTILKYTNKNADRLTWYEAAHLLVEKRAAFFIHGDWTTGYYKALDWMPVMSPAPGTSELFAFNVDAFAVCKNAPHPENARRFAGIAGTEEGQTAFNRLKGSLPTHKSVDVRRWGKDVERTYREFLGAKYQVSMDKYEFVGLDHKVGALFRQELGVDGLVKWIAQNYKESLLPYDSPKRTSKR